MISVIGTGTAGINIAEHFSQFPQYSIYKIGDIDPMCENDYRWVPDIIAPEKIEESAPDLRKACKDMDDIVYYFAAGDGRSINASLAILQQFREKEIHVFYLKPEDAMLTSMQKMQSKATYSIMQEYARSGLFKSFNIINNYEYENTIGQIPIMDYWPTINQSIVSTLHMINVFHNDQPAIGKIKEAAEISRIKTFGNLSMENFEEKMFFPLDNVTQKRYYIGINKERLKTDSELYSRIIESMREKSENGDIDVSYAVYATNYDYDIAYCEFLTHVIQPN
tara:strand:- start:92 stop:931 length:840 start_codon:yes stop_codon:yes gene_type:complete